MDLVKFSLGAHHDLLIYIELPRVLHFKVLNSYFFASHFSKEGVVMDADG